MRGAALGGVAGGAGGEGISIFQRRSNFLRALPLRNADFAQKFLGNVIYFIKKSSGLVVLYGIDT